MLRMIRMRRKVFKDLEDTEAEATEAQREILARDRVSERDIRVRRDHARSRLKRAMKFGHTGR